LYAAGTHTFSNDLLVVGAVCPNLLGR
jgi:hypothetical protein